MDLRFDAKGDHLTVTLTASGGAAEAALREGVDELTRSILQRGRPLPDRGDPGRAAGARHGRQDLRQDDRRDGQARGDEGREGGREQPRREPATTAEAWYDLASEEDDRCPYTAGITDGYGPVLGAATRDYSVDRQAGFHEAAGRPDPEPGSAQSHGQQRVHRPDHPVHHAGGDAGP